MIFEASEVGRRGGVGDERRVRRSSRTRVHVGLATGGNKGGKGERRGRRRRVRRRGCGHGPGAGFKTSDVSIRGEIMPLLLSRVVEDAVHRSPRVKCDNGAGIVSVESEGENLDACTDISGVVEEGRVVFQGTVEVSTSGGRSFFGGRCPAAGDFGGFRAGFFGARKTRGCCCCFAAYERASSWGFSALGASSSAWRE